MTTQFSMNRDINGHNGFGLKFSNDIYINTLAQNTEKTLVVPNKNNFTNTTGNKFLAIFSYEPGANVFVALNNTATLSSVGEFVSSRSELNPVAREVAVGDTLHFITDDLTAVVEVSFYSIS